MKFMKAASSVVELKVFVVSNCVENISFKFEGGWGVDGCLSKWVRKKVILYSHSSLGPSYRIG